jgi:hypothetical protein
MYSTTQNYLYIKKRTLCNKKNKNTLADPSRILNLSSVPTLQLNQPITCPTNIDPSIGPFYEVYTIDPSGVLFEQLSCVGHVNVLEKYVDYPYPYPITN